MTIEVFVLWLVVGLSSLVLTVVVVIVAALEGS